MSLAVGAVVAGKFRVEEPLPSPDGAMWFRATDTSVTNGGGDVAVHDASEVLAASLEPGKHVQHQHLVRVIDVVEHEGGHVVVQELVRGETLADRLRAVGAKTPVDAVRTALRIADAVSKLHDAGGAHGSLRPESVVIAPESRAAPVVTFAPEGLAASAFRSPERGALGPPTATDDAWATAALLFTMLTGNPPPSAGLSPAELASAGIADDALRTALEHGLSPDSSKRNDTITMMKRELARWFVDHSGDDTDDSIVRSQSKPPPLPAGSSAPPHTGPAPAIATGPVSGVAASTRPAPPKSNKALLAGLAVGALALGLGGVWVYSKMRPKQPEVVEVEVAKSAENQEVDLAAVPVMAESEASSCATSWLPKDAFAKPPNLDWLCKEQDPTTGAPKLRVEIVKGAGGKITEANKIVARLGWYELAVYSTVYAGCCADAPPLEAPKPAEGCEDMSKALRDLGIAVVDGAGKTEAVEVFTKVVECESKANRAAVFKQRGAVATTEAQAFADYVESIKP